MKNKNQYSEVENSRLLLKDLIRTSSEQAKSCNGYCRNAIYAMMAVGWGLVTRSDLSLHVESSNIILPVLVIFLGVIYLVIDACIHYFAGNKSRVLINELLTDYITDQTAKYEMRRYSDFVFHLLKYKIAYGIFMATLLAIHVFSALN